MPQRSPTFLLILAGVVIGALALRAIFSRGKGWVEGLIGIAGGLAAAAIAGGIAHLTGQPPDAVSWLLPTAESWTAMCVAVGAMFGDRVASAIWREAGAFAEDPHAWLVRWVPWFGRGGGNA